MDAKLRNIPAYVCGFWVLLAAVPSLLGQHQGSWIPHSTGKIEVLPNGSLMQPSQPQARTAWVPHSVRMQTEGEGEDDLLGGGDDLGGSALDSIGPAAMSAEEKAANDAKRLRPDAAAKNGQDTKDPHADVFGADQYPSANKCAQCHKKIYDEWRVSNHAYASVSPMFQKFEQAVSQVTSGTVGYFCMRCHAPVATQMNIPRETSLVDGPPILREGVTCVACHRVKYPFDRVNGERRIEPGDIYAPVYGPIGGDGVAQVVAKADHFKVKLNDSDKRPGQEMHNQGIKFEQISQSEFCVSCHQVAVHPGIALEVVWAQYRASPACKKGVSCQDCHMGIVPGKASGYETGPCAEMSGKWVDPYRKHSNHMFYGPGFSIAHPGIFPHSEKAQRWKLDHWMNFDWRGGWGSDDFEKTVAAQRDRFAFPKEWESADERRDARKVLDENLKLIALKRQLSVEVMSNGTKIDGPYFDSPRYACRDLEFRYTVTNTSEGHNSPSGSLGAQPQLWLNATLINPSGERIWESGYLDGNGDLADLHSLQVNNGLCPPDQQLFNLQTKFLFTGVKGPDKEAYLPVPVDLDQLPFFRPGGVPTTVLNHPPFIRMEAHSIPPLGSKVARYKVPANLVTVPGRYRLSVRLRSRTHPIYFLRFCNATPEMERMMNEQILDVHQYSVEFDIH